jgi:hypothetical protein
VTSTNADIRFFRALQDLAPTPATQVSSDEWRLLFDEMVADERTMLAIAQRSPGVLRIPSTAPATAQRRFDKIQSREFADGAALRLALIRAGVHFCK